MRPGGQDLRSAFAALEAAGKAVTISAPIDAEYEAAAVLWQLAHGPAVRFDNVVGSPVPLVGNLLNTRDKLATVLASDEAGVTERLAGALGTRVPPTVVSDPPCQEVVGGPIDLLARFPVPRISEGDGGRYLTAGLLVARNPLDGRQNLAICRLEVSGPDRLGCYMAPTHSAQFLAAHKAAGTAMDVAVAIGCHPVTVLCSQLLVPFDEMEAAGALYGEPLRVARATTSDLLVPADAEIVLEGRIDPSETAEEGPFGEFPGTYAPAQANPVISLSAVTTRTDPWLQMIVGGRHPEHLLTGALARETTLLEAVRAVAPGTRRVVLTEGGACRFNAVVQMTPRLAGDARLAILAAATAQDLIKHVVVVDDDIDPTDPTEVEWAIATRSRADRDILVLAGMRANPVDPMAVERTIAKLGIDATLDPGTARPAVPGVPAAVAAHVAAHLSEWLGRGA